MKNKLSYLLFAVFVGLVITAIACSGGSSSADSMEVLPTKEVKEVVEEKVEPMKEAVEIKVEEVEPIVEPTEEVIEEITPVEMPVEIPIEVPQELPEIEEIMAD